MCQCSSQFVYSHANWYESRRNSATWSDVSRGAEIYAWSLECLRQFWSWLESIFNWNYQSSIGFVLKCSFCLKCVVPSNWVYRSGSNHVTDGDVSQTELCIYVCNHPTTCPTFFFFNIYYGHSVVWGLSNRTVFRFKYIRKPARFSLQHYSVMLIREYECTQDCKLRRCGPYWAYTTLHDHLCDVWNSGVPDYITLLCLCFTWYRVR